MINIDNVRKFTLSDISLNVPEGGITGLIGASGAGKTTLIKLACGLLAPDSGNVFTLGKDPVRYRGKYGADISVFIAGVPLLDADSTVKSGIELIAAMYGLTGAGFAARYAELAEKLGFADFADCRVRDLSLGQKMRAELGAALIYDPKLLLLDEPNIGLDANGKAAFRAILKERAAAGMTVLLTSHDMAGISALCSRIAILDAGKLIFCGSLGRLQSRYMPVNTMTIRFNGNIPDPDDLPVRKYSFNDGTMTLEYDTNHITAAEITALIMSRTEIAEISIHKPDLEDILMQIRTGEKNEPHRSKEHQQDI